MKQILVQISEKDVKRLQYRMNSKSMSNAIRFAVKLCANMNMGDFKQFLQVYADQVEKELKIDETKHSKSFNRYGKINEKGGLNALIACNLLGYSIRKTAKIMGVSVNSVETYLKLRGLKWGTLTDREILYQSKDGKEVIYKKGYHG